MNIIWNECTREEIRSLNKEKSIVVLPLASIEQHGAHLPVGTDTIILESLIKKMQKEADFGENNVVYLPLMAYGKSNEHMGFPGTITYSAQTYYCVLQDIVKSVAASGFEKVVLFNSHGGNTDMLNLISRDLRIELGIEVFVFDWWFTPFWNEGLKDLKESGKYGVFHACELETSLMLSCAPHTVHMELAVDEDPVETLKDNHYATLFGPVNVGWKTADVTKSGVIGAPTYATEEKGNKLFEYAVKTLTDIFNELFQIKY